ncbi:hypothetical protein CYMTET_51799 [Cymbomonas tetramitiformis]|uniref:CCR4-NOT transcription complex subunit 10 n=1 Tax=Cymbomonas tetramitiformis TaxID=36881 RepID=A0AAE0ERF9_9CHLO|nr:hypothetical protein CYMTET_51799 [Cymbomonas tetramitiformis]
MTEGSGDLAAKAAEAAKHFREKEYAEALEVLEEMRQKKEGDPKVLHNIAVVDYYRGSCTEPQLLLDALKGVQGACEELSRVAEQQLEGIGTPSTSSNSSAPMTTSSGNSQAGSAQASAATSSATALGAATGTLSTALSASGPAVSGSGVSLTYIEEYDTSLPTLNTAILLYHMHQHARAAALVEPLYRNIEPLDEAAAMTICLLLLDIWLESRQPEKAAGVLLYLEKAFGYLLEKGEEGSNSTGTSGTDRVEPLDASSTSAPLSLAGVAGDKEAIPEDLSSASRAKLSSGNQRPKSVEDKSFPIPPAEFRMWLHLFKARLHLLTRNMKATKREVKCALNGMGSPLAPPSTFVGGVSGGASTTQLTLTQRQALFLKAQLEYSRRNYRKATKLLFSAAGSSNEVPAMRTIFLNNVGCIHHQLGKHNMAALYFSQALSQATAAFSEGSSQLSLPSFSRDKRLPILYNAALQHLLCGNYALAVRCFHESAAQYHNQPLLWLRLAECCVGAYLKQELHTSKMPRNAHRGASFGLVGESSGGAGDSGEQLAHVVGAPEWRRLLLSVNSDEAGATPLGWSGLDDEGALNTPNFTGEDTSAAPVSNGEGSEGAAHCLRNACVLLDRAEAAPEAAAPLSTSLGAAAFQTTAPQGAAVQGGAPTESKGSIKGPAATSGDGLRETKEAKTSGGSSTASIAAFAEEKASETSLIRQSVLANTAHLWLLCDHPLAALKAAEALMQVKGCSKESAFLSHTYAAEALCLLERPAEAVEHLSASMMQHSSEDSESGEAPATSDGSNGSGDRDKEDDVVGNGQPTHFAVPSEVSALTGSAARASLYINLAAVYATQEEHMQAQQCALQALAIAPSSAQALLALVYVEAPPVRTEHHYYPTINPPPAFLASGQREVTDFGSSESEDESEYPVGYYDDSSDDADENYEDDDSHVPYGSEQEPPVDTGFYGEPCGGVLEPPLGDEFLPQTDVSVSDDSFIHNSEALHSEAELEEENYDDSYSPAEWAAWEAGQYEGDSTGGAFYDNSYDYYGGYEDSYYDDSVILNRQAGRWIISFLPLAVAEMFS